VIVEIGKANAWQQDTKPTALNVKALA